MPHKNQSDMPMTAVSEIRKRARQHLEGGAVTEGYRADREAVIRLLNESLATELVCVLRYRRHAFMAHGMNATAVAEEFMQHSIEEQAHADLLARRITQLNGEPNLNPEGMLTRAHSEYVEATTIAEMIKEDLIAERIAIDSYSEMVRYLSDNDPTTRRLLEEILAKEEEHAEDMSSLLMTHTPNS